MIIKQLTNDEFTKFADNYSIKSIYQTKEYAFIMNKQNFESIFLGMMDNNNIVAASIFLIEKRDGFKYAYAPHGFLIDYENNNLVSEFTNGIKKFLGKINVIALKLNPLIVKYIYNSNKEIIYSNPKFEEIFNNLKKLGYYHLGFNDNFEEMKKIAEFLSTIRYEYVELLPYHNMGEHKYLSLGRTAERFYTPTNANMQLFRELFEPNIVW